MNVLKGDRDKANYGKVCQSTFGEQPLFFLLRALRLYSKELGTQLQATVSTTKSHQSPEEFR